MGSSKNLPKRPNDTDKSWNRTGQSQTENIAQLKGMLCENNTREGEIFTDAQTEKRRERGKEDLHMGKRAAGKRSGARGRRLASLLLEATAAS